LKHSICVPHFAFFLKKAFKTKAGTYLFLFFYFQTMNRLSCSLFGQLFYLRNSSHFVQSGFVYASKKKQYQESFIIGARQPSFFKFSVESVPYKSFFFKSIIELHSEYREHYMFEANQFGAKECYQLYKLNDGFCETLVPFDQDMGILIQNLKKDAHITVKCSCCSPK
jgi:hypothetical protein